MDTQGGLRSFPWNCLLHTHSPGHRRPGEAAFLAARPPPAGLLIGSRHLTHCRLSHSLQGKGSIWWSGPVLVPRLQVLASGHFPVLTEAPGSTGHPVLAGRAHVWQQGHCVGIAGGGCLSFMPVQRWQRHRAQHSPQSPSSNPARGT